MSVPTVVPAAPTAQRATNAARLLLLPELLSAFTHDTAALQRRTLLSEARDARQRRREEMGAELTAAHAEGMRPVDIQRQEAKAGTGRATSRAHALQQPPQNAVRSGERQEGGAFRQALAEAQGRPPAGVSPSSAVSSGTQAGTGSVAVATMHVPGAEAVANPRSHPAVHAVATPVIPAQAVPVAGVVPTPAMIAGGSAVTSAPGSARSTTSGVTAVVAASGTGGAGSGQPSGAASSTATVGVGPQGALRAGLRGANPAPSAQLTLEPAEEDVNVTRLVRLVQTRLGHDRSIATMRLDPPELGTMRVRMDMNQSHLILEVETQTSVAQRLLTEQVEHLRQRLEAAGIQLERMEVRAPAAPERAAQEGQSQMQDGGGAAQQEAADRRMAWSAELGWVEDEDVPELTMAEPAATAFPEPAAESLVNVLA